MFLGWMYPWKPDSNLAFRNVRLFTSHGEVTLILEMQTTKKRKLKVRDKSRQEKRAEAS